MNEKTEIKEESESLVDKVLPFHFYTYATGLDAGSTWVWMKCEGVMGESNPITKVAVESMGITQGLVTKTALEVLACTGVYFAAKMFRKKKGWDIKLENGFLYYYGAINLYAGLMNYLDFFLVHKDKLF